MLFIDGRKLSSLIPGSRRQKQLSGEEIDRIAGVYRQFRTTGAPSAEPGFCGTASVERIRDFRYVLTSGRYVGAGDDGGEDEPFEERFPKLASRLREELDEADALSAALRTTMEEFSDVG